MASTRSKKELRSHNMLWFLSQVHLLRCMLGSRNRMSHKLSIQTFPHWCRSKSIKNTTSKGEAATKENRFPKVLKESKFYKETATWKWHQQMVKSQLPHSRANIGEASHNKSIRSKQSSGFMKINQSHHSSSIEVKGLQCIAASKI